MAKKKMSTNPTLMNRKELTKLAKQKKQTTEAMVGSTTTEKIRKTPVLLMAKTPITTTTTNDGSTVVVVKKPEEIDNGRRNGRRMKKCTVAFCGSGARSRGLCKAHGGGKRCDFSGCCLSDQGGGFCIRHGGGKRCSVANCANGAQSRHLCKAHGGGRRCDFPYCTKSSQGGGRCRAHGGGPKWLMDDPDAPRPPVKKKKTIQEEEETSSPVSVGQPTDLKFPARKALVRKRKASTSSSENPAADAEEAKGADAGRKRKLTPTNAFYNLFEKRTKECGYGGCNQMVAQLGLEFCKVHEAELFCEVKDCWQRKEYGIYCVSHSDSVGFAQCLLELRK